MRMWRNECPKCGGDVHPQREIDGIELSCLQCGHRLNRDESRVLLRSVRRGQRELESTRKSA